MEITDFHGESGYKVYIGGGILEKVLKSLLCPGMKVFAVTDSNVEKIHLPLLSNTVKGIGCDFSYISFPASEGIKSPENLFEIWNRMSEAGMRRSDVLIALGGGTVGDLGGFAASSYMRGIPVIQIPTTLLACVDSSIGGKTAVNLPGAKNAVGAFKRPMAVICDTDFLSTLPEAEIRNGMAEVIKYSLACDSSVIPLIEANTPDYSRIILKCINAKKKYVEADEFDTGARMTLNFGHTVGHAIETLSEYSVPHGTAVAMGFCKILRCEAAAGMCGEEVYKKAMALAEKYGLPTDTDYTAEELVGAMKHDKKASVSGQKLVLLKDIGEAYTRSFTENDLYGFLNCNIK